MLSSIVQTRCRPNGTLNRTVPPCSVGRRIGHTPSPAAAVRPRALQTTTDGRRQCVNQYWLIRRASNNANRSRVSTSTFCNSLFVRLRAQFCTRNVATCLKQGKPSVAYVRSSGGNIGILSEDKHRQKL